MMAQTRRAMLATAGTLAVGGVSQQALGQSRSRPPPLRIGCITALSGPQEVIGRPILDGASIAADQVNARGGILGRPVEIVPVDVHADPAAGRAAVERLTELGVNLLCGVVTSDVGLAVAPLLAPANAVMMVCSAQSEKLTHEAFTPNLFRITDQTFMRNHAQARLMAERYPHVTDWAAIIPDVEYGRSAYAAFRDGLMEYYPKLAKCEATFSEPILAPFGATNFTPQLAKLKESGSQGLLVAVYGGDAVGLYRQALKLGLMNQVQVLADSYNEFLVPLELGGMTPEHLWLGMTWYYGGYHSAVSQELYADYLRCTGNAIPPGFVSTGHAAVHAYAAAAWRAGSVDTKPVIKMLEGMMLDTAKGTLTFRAEDHQAVCDVNFIRIKSGAELGMDILEHMRSDVEVAEFVRYDGADVIEPASGAFYPEVRQPRLLSRLASEDGHCCKRLLAPGVCADYYMAVCDAARGQQLVHQPQAQREADVEPDGVADDLGWEAMAGIAGNIGRCHPAWLPGSAPTHKPARRQVDGARLCYNAARHLQPRRAKHEG